MVSWWLNCSLLIPPLIILLSLQKPIQAVRFHMHDRERRCFQFEAAYSSRVIGVASVANGNGDVELSFEVKSKSDKLVYESKRGSGSESEKFAFTLPNYYDKQIEGVEDDEDYDYYEREAKYDVCLFIIFHETQYVANANRSVEFWIRPDSRGGQRDNHRMASQDSVNSITDAVENMQTTLTKIIGDLAALQQREIRLVKRTESTSGLLLRFAIVAVVVLLISSILQIMYYKTYFKAKKLI